MIPIPAPSPVSATPSQVYSFEGVQGLAVMPPPLEQASSSISADRLKGGLTPVSAAVLTQGQPVDPPQTITQFFSAVTLTQSFKIIGGREPFNEIYAEIIMPLETFEADGDGTAHAGAHGLADDEPEMSEEFLALSPAAESSQQTSSLTY
jgi:hypothetical protein